MKTTAELRDAIRGLGFTEVHGDPLSYSQYGRLYFALVNGYVKQEAAPAVELDSVENALYRTCEFIRDARSSGYDVIVWRVYPEIEEKTDKVRLYCRLHFANLAEITPVRDHSTYRQPIDGERTKPQGSSGLDIEKLSVDFNNAGFNQDGSFSWALNHVKSGNRVTRKGWNGRGMFIFLVPASKFTVNRPPLLGIYAEGAQVSYQDHIDMKTADGRIVPWVASQSDLLAIDWKLIV